jgi:hypothetical protein
MRPWVFGGRGLRVRGGEPPGVRWPGTTEGATLAWHTVEVRLTEFWARMEQVLGTGYYSSWSQDHVLDELGGRTVDQALRDGDDAKSVWRAVVADLQLPATFR